MDCTNNNHNVTAVIIIAIQYRFDTRTLYNYKNVKMY